ncbi:methyltransferase domain-containing protein [Dyella sp. LX-66]|uniref:class I SAM-dependent methyltransferase n=1 Tax=unclassified Dyella TaxID=2634549 RepID=UPI001BDFDC65|nr:MULTISPECIES: methyltransferase domain-containing protein [unclassified Dyella]MBT2118565.1 methyltransferase domain-containing protein [Dyella sp. LX-1]MBT2142036.1 methyltransferase domain-containing protein [Dyella sp. LX-66]
MDDRAQPFEAAILSVWRENAEPWTVAVQQRRIESRRLVTDRAIVDAVLSRKPRSAVDLGCGEGWLARALSAQGVDVLGVDAVPELIDTARAQGGGRFEAMSYAQIAAGALDAKADVAICNFSLLGKASAEAVLAAVPRLLEPGGALLVQTLHPLTACGELPYQDGWREGSWAGCGGGFGQAAPWYFRTLGGWLDTFAAGGLRVARIEEPLHPHSGRPASIIFVLEPSTT